MNRDRTKKQIITAVAFIYDDQNRMFVARRADTKKFMPGVWELPGGHIEFGESVEGGLAREIMEEFGADVTVTQLFDSFTYVSADGFDHTIEIACFAKLRTSQRLTLNPVDHSDCEWINEKQIEKYLKENDAEMKVGIKGFELLRKIEK